MKVLARLVLTMYQKHMGHVDRVDKNVALFRLRLKRCIKRYHRALFMWYIAVILNNVIVLFALLFIGVDDLMKSKEKVGYKHWFQNALGNVLIDHGLELAMTARRNEAAVTITKYIRYRGAFLTTVKSLLTKLRNVRIKRAINTSRRVLYDRSNGSRSRGSRKNVGGRPKKRKRGGGRKSSTSTDVEIKVVT